MCEDDGDCKYSHHCVEDAFRAVKPVCRQVCENNAECASGSCKELLRGGGKVCQ